MDRADIWYGNFDNTAYKTQNITNNHNMKTIKNDYCIRMFTGHDAYRPAMASVSFKDGYLYATNAYMVAKIKSDLCVHEYKEVEKFPSADKLFLAHMPIEKKTMSVDAIFNDLVKIEVCFRPKMIDCDSCEGEGVCHCDCCDSEYDCKKCKGTGNMPGPELELSGDNHCTLFDKKYQLKFLDLIIRTAVYTGVKEIEISNAEGTLGTVFSVGDFTILLMPVSQFESGDN